MICTWFPSLCFSPDIPPFVEDRHQEAPVRVDEEVGGPSLEEEQELSRVQGEDASSLLAALDRRVSLIVSQTPMNWTMDSTRSQTIYNPLWPLTVSGKYTLPSAS